MQARLIAGRLHQRRIDAAPRRRPFAGLAASLARHLRTSRQRARERREIAAMSGIDLADLGLTRHDLPRLFDTIPPPRARQGGPAQAPRS